MTTQSGFMNGMSELLSRALVLLTLVGLAAACRGDLAMEEGMASFYADSFEGKATASGEPYQASKLTAAHRTLPFGTRVKVTNLENGKTVKVTINDRGPFVEGRIIDLSDAAAQRLDFKVAGTVRVRLEFKKME